MLSINKRIKLSVATQLFPHQRDTVHYFDEMSGRCFCFSEQGVGKSLSALAYLAVNPHLRPAFIICPASLKLNWRREAKQHVNLPVVVLSGESTRPLQSEHIYVINYDIMQHWVDTIIKAKPQIAIFDEFQACKSIKAKRTKACKKLAMFTNQVIGMTGTPITNRPSDLFSLLNIVTPTLFPSWFSYINRYCNVKRMPWGIDYSGSSNLKELHEKIKPHFIRHTKAEVLPDLPKKQRIIVPVDLTNRKDYTRAEADFLKWLEQVKPEKMDKALKAEALVKLASLRELVVQGKMSALMDWIDTYLENERKLVLFMCHTDPLHQIFNAYKKMAVMIDGSVSMKQRDKAVQEFQTNPKKLLFCGNIVAAGTGLTLTAADTAVFGELSYIPADHAQAEDRINRIGATADCTQSYYLIADNTLEEKVCSLLHTKMTSINQVIEGHEADSAGWDFKKELMIALRNKN